MCGISGHIGEGIHYEVGKFNDVLIHRGPDAGGIYQSPTAPVVLGHRRLSIIDLSSASNQPFTSSCGNYIIVFNGEIYNYKELKSNYNLQCRTESDTEVILELFKKVGGNVASLLNGMFAFAIYDIPRQRIYIARDPVGIKPLYYEFVPGKFSFTSEIKSFLTDHRKRKLNTSVVQDFFTLGYIPEPNTAFEGIKKFPAGHYLWIDVQNINTPEFIDYWSIEKLLSKSVLDEENLAIKKLEDILFASIERQMISDVPVGVFLSGGIDSGIVTAIASKIKQGSINTFTIGLKNQTNSEAVFASKIAEYHKSNHRELIVHEDDVLQLFPAFFDIFDDLFGDSSAFPTYLVSELAKNNQTKVVLTGDGGDELFMGYGMYAWANRLDNPAWYMNRSILFEISKFLNPRLKRSGKMFDYLVEEDKAAHIFSQDQNLFHVRELNQLLKTPIDISRKYYQTTSFPRKLNPDEYQSLFDFNFYLKDDLLVKVDRATMQQSIESRVPLLDLEMIQFSVNLDESLKIKNQGKYLLKKVLYRHIPENYYNRPKKGFSIPLMQWLKGPLKNLIDDHLNEDKIKEVKIIQPEYVKDLINRFNAGEDAVYNRIWHLIVFMKWFERRQSIITIED